MTESKRVSNTLSNTLFKAKRKNKRSSTFNSKQPDRNSPFALTQIQYRSYQQEIIIYHFRTRLMSVATFRALLKRGSDLHGYIDTLMGSEKLLLGFYVPDGDDVPNECFEFAYLSVSSHVAAHLVLLQVSAREEVSLSGSSLPSLSTPS
jgi:hypothetical protein